MKSKIICLTVLALTFAARAEVIEDIKENVRDNWRKIQDIGMLKIVVPSALREAESILTIGQSIPFAAESIPFAAEVDH